MKLRFLTGVAAGAFLAQAAANAQDFSQGAPKQLPPEPGLIERPAEAPVSEDTTPVTDGLRGIVLVSGPLFLANFKAEQADGVKIVRLGEGDPGVDLDLLDNDEFRTFAKSMLGKPLTVADLERFSRDIVTYFRLKGHPLVDVRVPVNQDDPRTSGMLIVTVSEFLVGEVHVRGLDLTSGSPVLTPKPKYFDADIIRDGLRLKKGSRIQELRVVEDLNFLSNNPFRRVDLIYSKAEEVGYTDLTLRVAERRPFRAYVGYENTGTVATQRDRYSAGFNWGNVFNWDHQFSYQFTASENLFSNRAGNPDPSFVSHSFTYLAPINSGIPYHDSLLFFGTYQRAAPVLGAALGQIGKNYQLSGRYLVQLPSPADSKQQVMLGYDYKRTNNNLLFGGTSISRGVTEIHQAVIEYAGEWNWRVGGIEGRSEAAQQTGTLYTLRVGNTTVLSPGGIGNRNSSAAFRPGPGTSGTPFASADYAYNRLTVAPSVLFENGVEGRARGMWQIATGNLLATEQLSAAGPSYVRGYDPSSLIGTNGFLLSAELLTPIVLLSDNNGRFASRGRLGVFLDYGTVGDPDRAVGIPAHVDTSSTGLTASYSLGSYVTARLDYGWQLKRLPTATRRGELGYVAITVGF